MIPPEWKCGVLGLEGMNELMGTDCGEPIDEIPIYEGGGCFYVNYDV